MADAGLAATMTYGDGSDNTVTHYYAGTMSKPKKRKKRKSKKKGK